MYDLTEDDKVSLEDLQAKLEEDEDHVQSTDIAAMQSTLYSTFRWSNIDKTPTLRIVKSCS